MATITSAQARILRFVHHDPGASTRVVAQAVERDESTVSYHLTRMSRDGLVVGERTGRELAWFPEGTGLCPVLRRAMPAFRRRPTVARLALALDERPRRIRDLARKAGLELGEARWAAEVLAEAGLLARDAAGRARLADGGAHCVQMALSKQRCERWGGCAPSLGTLDA